MTNDFHNNQDKEINISLRGIRIIYQFYFFMGLLVISNAIIICWLYFLGLDIEQNNKDIKTLRKEITINNRNFTKLMKEVDLINRNFTKATEDEIVKEAELETAYEQLEIERNRNLGGNNQKRNVLPEDEARIVEKFKNALFNEQNIKEATLTNLKGTKVLLPVNQKARNKNSKEYIKNLLSKLKGQYNFDDYKIEIIWSDGTTSSL